MADRRVLVIYQGSDNSGTLPFADAANGDFGYGQIKRWAGGQVLANLSVSVDDDAKTITWSISNSESALLTRPGYYDIKIVRGSQIITVFYGPAVLRGGITDVPATPNDSAAWGVGRWGGFNWPSDTATSPWGAFPWGQDQWR